MLNIITIVALVFSVISFAMFVRCYFFEQPPASPPPQSEQGLGSAEVHGSVSDMAQLIEALAKLSDSFSNGGRGFALLVSAIFFLLVAAVGAGFDTVAAAITA